MRVFIGVLLACSVVVACDDAEPGPSGGEGGAGGEAGAGGAGGAAGEGGQGGAPLTESCDAETRCASPDSVCREDRNGWRCVTLEIPVGEECEDDEDCGGLAVGGDCGRVDGGEKVCHATCFYDTECPAGMVCERGLFLCEVLEATDP